MIWSPLLVDILILIQYIVSYWRHPNPVGTHRQSLRRHIPHVNLLEFYVYSNHASLSIRTCNWYKREKSIIPIYILGSNESGSFEGDHFNFSVPNNVIFSNHGLAPTEKMVEILEIWSCNTYDGPKTLTIVMSVMHLYANISNQKISTLEVIRDIQMFKSILGQN